MQVAGSNPCGVRRCCILHTLHQKMAGHSNSNTLDKGLMVAKWWLCAVTTYALALCFPELPDCMEKIHPALLHVLRRAGRCCAVLRVLVGAARCCAGAARRWAISGLNKRGAARCCGCCAVLRGCCAVCTVELRLSPYGLCAVGLIVASLCGLVQGNTQPLGCHPVACMAVPFCPAPPEEIGLCTGCKMHPQLLGTAGALCSEVQ